MGQLGEEKSFKALNKFIFLAKAHSVYKYLIKKNANPRIGKCIIWNNFNFSCLIFL